MALAHLMSCSVTSERLFDITSRNRGRLFFGMAH